MEDRQEGPREGRVDGGQVVGTDTSAQGTRKHAIHTLMCPKIQPVRGISLPFLTFLFLQTLFVCVSVFGLKAQFVSGNLKTGIDVRKLVR